MKKLFATLALATVLTFGTGVANAKDGILISDLTGDSKPCEAQTNNVKDGILISDYTGIIILGFTGILISDLTGTAEDGGKQETCGIIILG